MRLIYEVWSEIVGRFHYFTGMAIPKVVIKPDCSCRKRKRHFACTDFSTDPVSILVCPDLVDEGISAIRGVLVHELGHLVEATRWWYPFPKGLDAERRADILAEATTGWKVYYDQNTLVQRAGPGARGVWPRPKGLW